MKRSVVAVMAGVCLLMTASVSKAQSARFATDDEWQEEVRVLLAADDMWARDLGLRPAFRPYLGELNDGHYMTVDYDLTAGQRYYFVGVCDADCSDIDFRLVNDYGREVGRDLQPNDTPIVTVTPRESGRFHLRVIMASCSADPCRFGVATYGD
jgi:hypothetical protein